jgi:hypothetical protein
VTAARLALIWAEGEWRVLRRAALPVLARRLAPLPWGCFPLR